MKTIVINTAATWDPNLLAFQNTDKFKEVNTDQVWASIGDRLGFLKTYADGKATLDGVSNTWTGTQFLAPSNPSTVVSLKLFREMHFVDLTESPTEALRAGLHYREVELPDANSTVSPNADTFIVPQTTGARTYKFNSYGGNDGRRIRVTRPRAGDAHVVTIQDGSSVTAIAFPSGAAGWVDLEYRSAKSPAWLPRAYGGTVTSVSQVV